MLPFVAILTTVIIAAITVGLIVWDLVVYKNNVPNSLDTISGRMKAWGKQALILPWAWAVLFGHFWGPIKAGQLMPMKVGLPLLVLASWSVLLLGMYLRQHGIGITTHWLVFFLILNLGALAGACLWPQ